MSKIRNLAPWLGAPLICLSILAFASGCSGGNIVTLRAMIGNSHYWPPRCDSSTCVLTGLGGVTRVWERHVDENLALGRHFVVEGVCASACEIAAQRAHARVMPGARLIKHTPSPTVMS